MEKLNLLGNENAWKLNIGFLNLLSAALFILNSYSYVEAGCSNKNNQEKIQLNPEMNFLIDKFSPFLFIFDPATFCVQYHKIVT